MITTIIAAIISALTEAFKLTSTWISYARDKLLVALGGAQQKNTDLQGRLDAIKAANKARNEAERSLERDTSGGVPVDDGFRRVDKAGDD